jgi:hypothetical protein
MLHCFVKEIYFNTNNEIKNINKTHQKINLFWFYKSDECYKLSKVFAIYFIQYIYFLIIIAYLAFQSQLD